MNVQNIQVMSTNKGDQKTRKKSWAKRMDRKFSAGNGMPGNIKKWVFY